MSHLRLGLATGRAGIGIVIDHSGNDTYRLSPGSGGVGLAGLGILYDGEGQDIYEGSRFTQGAAFGGFGLLVDRAGDDRYTSFGYALGFGAPLGVGAVIDVAGNDSYECGGHYPSAYNAADAPDAQPHDAGYQFDCFRIRHRIRASRLHEESGATRAEPRRRLGTVDRSGRTRSLSQREFFSRPRIFFRPWREAGSPG